MRCWLLRLSFACVKTPTRSSRVRLQRVRRRGPAFFFRPAAAFLAPFLTPPLALLAFAARFTGFLVVVFVLFLTAFLAVFLTAFWTALGAAGAIAASRLGAGRADTLDTRVPTTGRLRASRSIS